MKREQSMDIQVNNQTLRKMNRRELLEILVAQGRKIEDLENEITALNSELSLANERLKESQLTSEDVKTIAKASLMINELMTLQYKSENDASGDKSRQTDFISHLLQQAETDYKRLLRENEDNKTDDEEKTE